MDFPFVNDAIKQPNQFHTVFTAQKLYIYGAEKKGTKEMYRKKNKIKNKTYIWKKQTKPYLTKWKRDKWNEAVNGKQTSLSLFFYCFSCSMRPSESKKPFGQLLLVNVIQSWSTCHCNMKIYDHLEGI